MPFCRDEALLAERLKSLAAAGALSVLEFEVFDDLSVVAGLMLSSSIPSPRRGCTSVSRSIKSSVNGGVRNSRPASVSDPKAETASKSRGSASNSAMSASLKDIPKAWKS